jgi:uncharacterized protein (DUF2062 family)
MSSAPLSSWPADLPVLIPVYNHVRTVGEVIRQLRERGALYILVVDDGSTDGSGDAARTAGADTVLVQTPNQGKGAALRMGLTHLARAGHRRVLTCDADLQHPADECLRLAIASTAEPEALWLGCRDMAGAPAASRFGRVWTSLWTWISCGVWPVDNQTGLRVYPLPVMSTLPVRAGRYAYEIESLVRAVWVGVAVQRLPVAVIYPPDRVSHFDLWRDNLRTAGAFTWLVTRRLLPWPHADAGDGHPWRTALRSGLEPAPAAKAVALGAAIGVAPLPGLQLICAAWFALICGLNPALTLLASNISLGPLLAAWFALEVVVGHLLLHGRTDDLVERMLHLRDHIDQQGAWTTLHPLLSDWLVGAVPVMAGVALVCGLVAWWTARAWHARSRV